MDDQIAKAQEEASSRKAIMERVDKWMSARDEERWLDEYNRVIMTNTSDIPTNPVNI